MLRQLAVAFPRTRNDALVNANVNRAGIHAGCVTTTAAAGAQREKMLCVCDVCSSPYSLTIDVNWRIIETHCPCASVQIMRMKVGVYAGL